MKNLRDLDLAREAVEETLEDDRIDPNNVREQMCEFCPWRKDGGVLHDSPEEFAVLRESVIFEANQRCHAPAFDGEVESQICRGARNYQINFFHRLGILSEPSDRAWAEALEELQIE
jgi:hypothetical protein